MARRKKSSPKSSGAPPPPKMVALMACVVATLILSYRLRRYPTDMPSLLSSSTNTLVVSTPNVPRKKPTVALEDMPSDWNEILKLRRQHKLPPDQQQQQPLKHKASGSAKVEITREQQKPPPPQQQQPQSHQLVPAILSRGDALYQKYTWDKSPIIIEKYKLVFFTIPKVGCTAFKQLFRRMMGYPNWRDHQYYNEPFLPHNPYTNGLRYLSDYSFEQANEMMTSDDWTRAIFVRNPDERVLSAFLDKAVYSQGYYLRMRCCDKFGPGSDEYDALLQCATGVKQYTKPAPGQEESTTPILTFEQFLSKILPKCSDPHWEPQAIRMAPKYWQKMNFIGRFENLHNDTKRLLTKLGAWDEYGASGWTANGQDGAMFDPKQKALHGTNAQKEDSKSKYFTPAAVEFIRQYYSADYHDRLLNFQQPVAQ